LVTPPDDGVIEMVEDLEPPADPLQPATSMNTSMAPAIPSRVRNRRTAGSMNNRAIASIMKSTCRSNADGGAFKDCGGTMNEAAVMDPAAEAPGVGAALVVATEHEVISIAGVQVKATAPVNPPNPVTSTGNEPVAPLATVMGEADTEKSHAVPARATVCGLPLAESVMVMALETGPGAVVALGLNVTVSTQVVPPGETVRTTGSVEHVLFVIVNGSVPGIEIADIVSGVTVLGLLIVTVCVGLVVVSSWPANVRFVGAIVMAAAVVLPMPVRPTVSGWECPGRGGVSALSGVASVAAFAPAADGVYVTPNVQEDPPGSDSPAVQVLPATGALKSAGLPAVAVMVTVNGKVMPEAVLFVMVKKNGWVAAPTSCVPKSLLAGVIEIVGVSGKSATKAFVAPVAPRVVWNAPAEVSMSGDVINPAIYALVPETAIP